ncbi:MAG: penicillin-binding protein 1A, partial [Xanthomonadales bacterium]|nr:penicillin-binding protein 1A [Xanthomonadales bacterium]
MHTFLRLGRYALILALCGMLAVAAAVGITYWLVAPRLPNVAQLKDVQLQVPLRVLSADGKLIATFGETRRIPVHIDHVPKQLKQAVLSAEDANFYHHPGVDWHGVVRAAVHVVLSGGAKGQGGSTITQQVARSFFLSPQKLYTRKVIEMFIAFRMENVLTKDEILELYLNKMFMGHRSYGVAAAAEYYYGDTLDQLSLAQCAMLASLFQLPSTVNPVTNKPRAVARRNWVLGQMLSNQFINKTQYQQAVAEKDLAFPHDPPIEVEAPYLAELVRVEALDRLGNSAMTDGYVVKTTIDSKMQREARNALRSGLIAYDHRHGYRGPMAHVTLPSNAGVADYRKALDGEDEMAGMVPGIVTTVANDLATVYLKGGQTVTLDFTAMKWAQPRLSQNSRGRIPKTVADILKAGDVIRLARNAKGQWQLAELPKAQAALISLDPSDGAIKAMVGGFSFLLSKFNRVTMAKRQPGSSFKPFLYSAALEHGFTAASIVNDAPLVIPDPTSPGGVWTPSNDDGKFAGPMRVRDALVQSKNLVSIRLLDAIGIHYTREYATRFGFDIDALPKSLSLALGSASVSPMTMARAYAVFANGGFLVEPYYISEIIDRNGKLMAKTTPERACRTCTPTDAIVAHPALTPAIAGSVGAPSALARVDSASALPVSASSSTPTAADLAPRVLDPSNDFIMTSMMQDVIRRGTGHAAMVLKRSDLAGKTGTTNDHRDAWFSGFNASIVTSVWVGFDDYSTLGHHEFGATAALPIWIKYMGAVLQGTPPAVLPKPDGVVSATIDRQTGLIAGVDDTDSVREYFTKPALAALRARSPNPEQPKKK